MANVSQLMLYFSCISAVNFSHLMQKITTFVVAGYESAPLRSWWLLSGWHGLRLCGGPSAAACSWLVVAHHVQYGLLGLVVRIVFLSSLRQITDVT